MWVSRKDDVDTSRAGWSQEHLRQNYDGQLWSTGRGTDEIWSARGSSHVKSTSNWLERSKDTTGYVSDIHSLGSCHPFRVRRLIREEMRARLETFFLIRFCLAVLNEGLIVIVMRSRAQNCALRAWRHSRSWKCKVWLDSWKYVSMSWSWEWSSLRQWESLQTKFFII